MLDYLNTPHYYSENLCDIDEQEDNSSLFLDTSADPQNIYTNNNVISNEPVAGSRIYENSSSTFHSYNRQSWDIPHLGLCVYDCCLFSL